MLTHVDKTGKAMMVDVSAKVETTREASAFAKVMLGEKVFGMVKENQVKKGDVLSVANIAGIQAGKKTSELIPLCHNIFIADISLSFELIEADFSVEIISRAKTNAVTGIEMEAMTAATIAALTIYDMCKGIDKSIQIKSVYLLSKSGGKSGNYKREKKQDE
jgi:molybdenum cofactor biosynthesis protein MoaC